MPSFDALEQSRDTRWKHHQKIAEAVAGVVGPRIEVDLWTCLKRSIGDGVRGMSRAGASSVPCELRRLLLRLSARAQGLTRQAALAGSADLFAPDEEAEDVLT